MHAPLTFEALAIAFFAAIGIAAFFTRAPHRRRVRVALVSVACATSVAAVVRTFPVDARLWLGHVYLAAGYWIPAMLVAAGPLPPSPPSGRCATRLASAAWPVRFRGPARRTSRGTRPTYADIGSAFETWLVRTDERCRKIAIAPPIWAVQILELSYLLCYVMVPAAFVVVWTNPASTSVDHFWTAVLLAGFGCYGSLPWLLSRPPRFTDAAPPRGIRRLNFHVLGRVSHGLNTFPSGHVAVSVAAALEVLSISRPAGAAFGVLAAAIAVGAVAGRYHYGIDVVLGIVVGIASSALL